jgi:LEA14-like dessication related protein
MLNRNSLYLLILSALLLSCKGVEDISFKGVNNVALIGMEDNRINFSADIAVFNPSTVGFRIREVNLKTSIDGIFLGTLTTNEPVKINARSDTSYHAVFSLELANIITGASTLYGLQRKRQVTVEMQGFVKASSWLTSRKVDVLEKQLIDVPQFSR